MKLFPRFFARRAADTSASSKGPVFSRVRPGHARATPRRYDRMAEEGFGQNVIVLRAITLVARSLASIPFRLMKDGRVLDTHPLLGLLARPNPGLQGTSFLHHLVGHYLIAGNAFVLGVGPKGLPPAELWLLRPDSMQVVEGADGLPAAYRQKVAGEERDFDANAVLHWKTFNPLSDWYGMAPLEAAATAVDAHNEGSRWNLALIQNGGTPSGVLYQEGGSEPLSDSQYKMLKKEVENRYTGSANAGRPLLLEGGLKWQDMGLSPKDMDWAQGKNMSAREIALAFGVPPQMLGVPDSQTYSNFAEARQSVWEDTIIPMAHELVGQLNSWLAPKFEPNLELSLNLDDLPALEAKRQRRLDRVMAADFLTDEEKRRALGFSSLPDGGNS